MSEYCPFGFSRVRPTREHAAIMSAAAERHGAELIELDDVDGYSRWFRVPRLGDAFDREVARLVLAECPSEDEIRGAAEREAAEAENARTYVSLGNGRDVGSGYDVEAIAIDGDRVLVAWTALQTRRCGLAEVPRRGRTLRAIATEAGDQPISGVVVWDDQPEYDALAERWDRAREVQS